MFASVRSTPPLFTVPGRSKNTMSVPGSLSNSPSAFSTASSAVPSMTG